MAVSRCPLCHVAHAEHTTRCDGCGYVFGQSVEALRKLLDVQLTRLMSSVFALVLVDALLVTMILTGVIVIPTALLVPALWVTGAQMRKIAITRHSLKQIEAKVPVARLLREHR